jgi:hypothetical protein
MGRVKPYALCDLSSTRDKHYRMRKTWRNTLVRPELWDPKPKILTLQAPPPERLFVEDPRPQQPATFANLTAQDIYQQIINQGI